MKIKIQAHSFANEIEAEEACLALIKLRPEHGVMVYKNRKLRKIKFENFDLIPIKGHEHCYLAYKSNYYGDSLGAIDKIDGVWVAVYYGQLIAESETMDEAGTALLNNNFRVPK
jgi:hypothetical protein